TYGHPAGDALLARLAAELDAVAAHYGAAYRLGGDEFCALVDVGPLEAGAFLDAALGALSETGDGFTVTTSFRSVFLPEEASTASDALRVADQRLYVQKREQSGRRAPHEMLLQALYERSPDLRDHVDQVVEDAMAVGESLGLAGTELEELGLAAR